MRRSLSILVVSLALVPSLVTPVTADDDAAATAAVAVMRGGPVSGTPLGPQDGERLALQALVARRAGLGLSAADVREVEVTGRVYDEDTATTHVHLRQLRDGIPVLDGVANISVARDGRVLTVGDRLLEGLDRRVGSAVPVVDAARAVPAAARAVGLPLRGAPQSLGPPRGATRATTFAAGASFSRPVEVALAWVAVGQGARLRLAWSMVLEDAAQSAAWDVAVDAVTGAVVRERNLVAHATDGASYEVFAPPLPRPGVRSVLSDPADAVASPHGWHDLDAAVGADTQVTRGNNAHAGRADATFNAVAAGTEVSGGEALRFAPPLDLSAGPATQRDAEIVNSFVWVNHAHDVLYRHGFDEDAANMQHVNRSGEGLAGDAVAVLADPRNSIANISPNSEGTSPVIRLGFQPAVRSAQIEVPSVDVRLGVLGVAGPDDAVGTGPGVVMQDSVAPVEDGCDETTQDLAGAVVLITPGRCGATTPVENARRKGAVAVVLLRPGFGVTSTTLPVVSIEAPEPDWLRARLPTELTVRNTPANTHARAYGLDNETVIHEYGHAVSARLVGGGSNVGCQASAEPMGEGWSDILALILTAQGTGADDRRRAYGTYGAGQAADGPGARRLPYSPSTDQSPFTYDDLKISGQTHFVGMRWASALWQVYWELIDEHGFEPDLTQPYTAGGNVRALRLILDGMKLTPCAPGFVDARDAVLLADQNLTGGQDQCALWRGFAARGLGRDAVQGSSKDRLDNTGDGSVPSVACTTPKPEDFRSRGGPAAAAAPGVLANDGAEDDHSAELVGAPAHGTVELQADGGFTYTPQRGFRGTDAFTYRLSDGLAVSPVARVEIAVEPPLADAGGPYETVEGSPVTLAAATSPTDEDLDYAWDFDDDGDFDDATGASPSFSGVYQDGTYPVSLLVTNSEGGVATGSSTVTVANVVPTVIAGPVLVVDEGGLAEFTARFTDPGVEDGFAATIDWGTGLSDATRPGALVFGPDPDTGGRHGTVSGSHAYGDDGRFTATSTVSDDDGSGSATTEVQVRNVAPSAAIDGAGAVQLPGGPVVVVGTGDPISLRARATDPGSDDLELVWDFAGAAPTVRRTSLVAPPDTDADPSPEVAPRQVDDEVRAAFTRVCVVEVTFGATDDDGGTATDTAVVAVTGTADRSRGAGFWAQQASGRSDHVSADEFLCLLGFVGRGSSVLDEIRDASTSAAAAEVLQPSGPPTASQRLDRQLLAVWLNVAHGGVALDTVVDVSGDGAGDMTVSALLAEAEAARTDARATAKDLHTQADRLERVAQRDG